MPAAVACDPQRETCDALDAQQSHSWLKIGIAAVFAGQGMILSLAVNLTPPTYGSGAYWVLHGGLILTTVLVVAFLGGPLFRSTWAMLRARRLSIDGLFTLSLSGAFIGSVVGSLTGEGSVYYEVVAVVIAIHTFGRMLGERSLAGLRTEAERLREHFDRAQVIPEPGAAPVDMPLSEVVAGSIVRVLPGDPVTVDGCIVSGTGYVRETALTGEPLPVVRREGQRLRAGTWSEDAVFDLRVEAGEGARELDRILEEVEGPDGRPSELQTQANEIIRGFLPAVAGVSAATAIFWGFVSGWVDAVLHSMAVLLVACPCAFGLATPVGIWHGLYRIARLGLVSRDGALIDALGRTRRLFFDKTGTLTETRLRLVETLVAEAWMPQRATLFGAVRALESRSRHPVALSLSQALPPGGPVPPVEALEIVPGQGLRGRCNLGEGSTFRDVAIGEATVVGAVGAAAAADLATGLLAPGKRIYVFVDQLPAAVFVLQEGMREGVAPVWQALTALGIEAEVLTGDPQPGVDLPEPVAVHRGLSASEKRARVEASREAGETPIFIGDGINDTAAMAAAVASLSMESGSGLARSRACGHLTGDRIDRLPAAIETARAVRRRLKGNLAYAAVYNVVGMGLAACGLLHPIAAALIMLVSSAWVTARSLGGTKADKAR